MFITKVVNDHRMLTFSVCKGLKYLSVLVYWNEMAKLSREDVLKLARLARISLNDNEVQELAEELSTILQYVEQLQGVDVADLKPTNQVTGLVNVTRKDTILDYGYQPKELLKNVHEQQDNMIKVKRMIG